MTSSNANTLLPMIKSQEEKFCPICNEEAQGDESHHPHYGGVCCYGCKAFFRRAHQRSKTPKLHCKYEGKCIIPAKGQLRCRKCRYNKCLANGMKPSLVLTNDEKKIRFRNFLKKKGDQEKMTIQSSLETLNQAPLEPIWSQNEIPANETPSRQQKFPRRDPHGVEFLLSKNISVSKRNTGDYTQPLSVNYPGLLNQHPGQSLIPLPRDQRRPEPSRVSTAQPERLNQDLLLFKAPRSTVKQSHPCQLNLTGQTVKRSANQQITPTVHGPNKNVQMDQDLAGYYGSTLDSQQRRAHNIAPNEFKRKLERGNERYLRSMKKKAFLKYSYEDLETNSFAMDNPQFGRESSCFGLSEHQSSLGQSNGKKCQNGNIGSRYQNPELKKQEYRPNTFLNASKEHLENKWILTTGDKEILVSNCNGATENLHTSNTKVECWQKQGTKNGNSWTLTDGHNSALSNSPSSLSMGSMSPDLEVEDLRTSIFENAMAENKWVITLPHKDDKQKNVPNQKLCQNLADIGSESDVLYKLHGKKYRAQSNQNPQVQDKGAYSVNKWLLTKDQYDFSKSHSKNLEEPYQFSVNKADGKANGKFSYRGHQERPWYSNKKQRLEREENDLEPENKLNLTSKCGQNWNLFEEHEEKSNCRSTEEIRHQQGQSGCREHRSQPQVSNFSNAIASKLKFQKSMNNENEERKVTKRIEEFTKDQNCLLLFSNKAHQNFTQWSNDEDSYYPPTQEKCSISKNVDFSPNESCHMMESESNCKIEFDKLLFRDKLESFREDFTDTSWSKKPDAQINSPRPCPTKDDSKLWAESSKFWAKSPKLAQQPKEREHTGQDFLSMPAQLCYVLEAFTLATRKLNWSTEHNQELILTHQRKIPMAKNTFTNQLSMVTFALTDFASSLYLFSSLSKEDQIILLKHNIPLYLQYIIARYFSSETGFEQLSWILEGQILIESIEEVTNLHRISLKRYNGYTNLLPTSANHYSHFSDNIGMFYPFPQQCNGLIANMLLYYKDDTMTKQLKEPARIACIFEEAKELVKFGFKHLDRHVGVNIPCNIGPLIQTLTKMKNIFDSCKVKTDGLIHSGCFTSSIPLNLVENEESWLKEQYSTFEAQFMSVQMSQTDLDSLINADQSGKQFQQKFSKMWMSMTVERIWRVLKIRPEFQNLTFCQQKYLWSRNCRLAVAAVIEQIHSTKFSEMHLQSVLVCLESSPLDWENSMSADVNLNELETGVLSPFSQTDNKSQMSNIFKIERLFHVMKEMSVFVDQFFMFFILLALLNTSGLPQSHCYSSLTQVRHLYLQVFQRKLKTSGCSFVKYAQMQKRFQKLNKLSNLETIL